MRSGSACLLSMLLCAGISFCQSEKPCVAGQALTLSDADGVTTKLVFLSGTFGKLSAHVFLPNTKEPVPGIAFSQSAIQYPDSRTNLLPFARALAQAGAASIMLEGTVAWQSPNDDSKRAWGEFNCAAQWLKANANLDPERLAIGGPIRVEGLPFCSTETDTKCGQPLLLLNYGWNDADGIRATKLMKTPQDQLQAAELLTSQFHLREVELSWLLSPASTGALAQR